MFDIKLESAITAIVEAALPVGSDHALYIRLDVSFYKNYGMTGKHNHSVIHFVFHRKTSYTKVWTAESDGVATPPLIDFKLTSDHDSCWRTDGFRTLTQAYFRMAKELAPKTAPIKLFQHCSFWSVDKAEIEFERDPFDKYGHMKVITKLEMIR